VRQRLLGFGTWCAALALGTVVFHGLGQGELAPPPLDPAAWGPWLEDRDALVATMALLRLLVVGLCWYLVGVTTIGTVARLLQAARLIRIADALTLPVVRRLLQQTFGVVLATTMITAGTGASPMVAAAAQAPITLAAADDEPASGPAGPPLPGVPRLPPRSGGTSPALPAQAPAPAAPEVTLRGLPAPALGEDRRLPWRIATGGFASTPDDPSDATLPGPEHSDLAPEGVVHTVRSGESLWRIASDQLERSLGRAVTDAEIVPYWRTLIGSNRERLPDRDDPDLILPGMELLLPPVAVP